MNKTTLPDILDVKQLQDFLKIGRNTAYKMLDNGEIPSFKIGSVYKIPRKELEKYIAQKTKSL